MKRQNRVNYKSANKRTIALALLICFIFVSLLSGAFILTHMGHEHDHNGTHGSCVICVQIKNAERILRLFGMAAAPGFTLFTGYYAAITLIRAIYSNIANITPITAKTRMNN